MAGLHRARYAFTVIGQHPLTQRSKAAAWKRWLTWQIGSRLVPGQVAVPWVNGTRLLVGPGMHGATLNVYVGLADFAEMAFLLHLLRPGDLFVDVGASVGVYTVLASGAVGCRSLAFEPDPHAFQGLLANMRLNGIGELVRCYPLAVGHEKGTIPFTAGLGTLNRVVVPSLAPASNPQSPTSSLQPPDSTLVEVEMTTLDAELCGQDPAAIKIDVEGFEGAVLSGGEATLRNPSLQAVIMEIGGGCARYGTTPDRLFERMAGFGFAACLYDPTKRQLTEITNRTWKATARGNTLFVRNVQSCTAWLGHASAFRVLGSAF